jgi:hypothetical protein
MNYKYKTIVLQWMKLKYKLLLGKCSITIFNLYVLYEVRNRDISRGFISQVQFLNFPKHHKNVGK